MRNKRWIYGFFSALCLFLLILDSKTAYIGAREGVCICLETLIPSLFPFILCSSIMTSCFIGSNKPFLHRFTRFLGIPKGGDAIFLIGMLGGYPIGAQVIYNAYKEGHINSKTAKRLLGFCCNAGPAFIFGIVGNLFESPYMKWIVWVIHILSAILTGLILPQKTHEICCMNGTANISIQKKITTSIQTMGTICGWVIVFRILIQLFTHWFLYLFPDEFSICFIGFLELTNGCIALKPHFSDGLKLIMCSCMLSLGGLCVWMQTKAVTKELGDGMYIPGKLLQTSISFILSGIIQIFLCT